MAKGYREVTVTETRKPFTVTAGQAISASLRRLQAEYGGKSLVDHFDGRDGEEVAQSTISRWISEPRRFPAVFLPTLVELDPVFRGEVFQILTASLATDSAVVERMSTKAADEYRHAVEAVIVEQVAPGRWGRTR